MNLKKIVFIICVAALAALFLLSAAGVVSVFGLPFLLAAGIVLYVSGVIYDLLVLIKREEDEFTLKIARLALLSWFAVIILSFGSGK